VNPAAEGSPLDVPEGGTPLGLGLDRPAGRAATTAPWPPGARLLLYTDGLVEARDPRGRFFPLLEHADVLGQGEPQHALDRLLDALTAHVRGTFTDDLAVVLLERCPAG
jgi:hypothetical protein